MLTTVQFSTVGSTLTITAEGEWVTGLPGVPKTLGDLMPTVYKLP